jgi:hypothetical protein
MRRGRGAPRWPCTQHRTPQTVSPPALLSDTSTSHTRERWPLVGLGNPTRHHGAVHSLIAHCSQQVSRREGAEDASTDPIGRQEGLELGGGKNIARARYHRGGAGASRGALGAARPAVATCRKAQPPDCNKKQEVKISLQKLHVRTNLQSSQSTTPNAQTSLASMCQRIHPPTHPRRP